MEVNFSSLAIFFLVGLKGEAKLKAIQELNEEEQEVVQVKCVMKIIFCWCANNYDNFYTL